VDIYSARSNGAGILRTKGYCETKPKCHCKSSTQQVPLTQSLSCDSAIELHLLCNPICAHYDDKRFSILAKGCSSFHLSILQAVFIKTSNPILCRQKKICLQSLAL